MRGAALLQVSLCEQAEGHLRGIGREEGKIDAILQVKQLSASHTVSTSQLWFSLSSFSRMGNLDLCLSAQEGIAQWVAASRVSVKLTGLGQ